MDESSLSWLCLASSTHNAVAIYTNSRCSDLVALFSRWKTWLIYYIKDEPLVIYQLRGGQIRSDMVTMTGDPLFCVCPLFSLSFSLLRARKGGLVATERKPDAIKNNNVISNYSVRLSRYYAEPRPCWWYSTNQLSSYHEPLITSGNDSINWLCVRAAVYINCRRRNRTATVLIGFFFPVVINLALFDIFRIEPHLVHTGLYKKEYDGIIFCLVISQRREGKAK